MTDQSVQLNFLSRADGSALYSLGDTVVLASVTGPTTTRQSNRAHNKCSLEVLFSPCNGQAMVSERSIEATISESVQQVMASHLHPRAAVLLTLQELQSQHQLLLLAASINASCLALMDAGVQLQGLLAAVCCSYTTAGVIQLWPGLLEAQESESVLTFVFESRNQDVVCCQQQGSLLAPLYAACLARCQEAAKDVFAFYREQMQNRYLKSDTRPAEETEEYQAV